ncbi:hypothetical protein [Novosphingobium sp. BL-52-GroH]|uniref:hypothetical protein n=1 Tax=Novosphingobium sp. BL-52-GroH TaxID=3349877 RepID=UPI00384ABEA9
MKLKNIMLSVAAAGVLAAPVAAQAGTTASAATGKIANVSGLGARQSMAVKGKQKADSAIIVLAVVGAGAAGYGIYEATKDDKSNGS